MTRHPDVNIPEKLAGEEGFEPSLPGPEPGVLPLDYSPSCDVAESKSRPLPGLLKGIVPSILPQKAAEIGKLIQSQLSNPWLRHTLLRVIGLFAGNATEGHFLLHSSDSSHRAPQPETPLLNSPLLKCHQYQLTQAIPGSLYILPTPLVRPLLAVSVVLCKHAVFASAREAASLLAPLTLPDDVVEVLW